MVRAGILGISIPNTYEDTSTASKYILKNCGYMCVFFTERGNLNTGWVGKIGQTDFANKLVKKIKNKYKINRN